MLLWYQLFGLQLISVFSELQGTATVILPSDALLVA